MPKQQLIYSYFAYGVLTTLITTFSLDKSIYQEYAILINCLQAIALCISSIFICHNLWAAPLRDRYIGVIWYSSIFVALAFIGSFLVLISKFSQISLVIFILNLAMIGALLNWQTTLLMMVSGSGLATALYQYYIGEPTGISSELYNLKVQIVYIVLMISGFMLAFLKPKQEQHELTEERAEHLAGRVDYQKHELAKALDLKNQFIRNVTHEYHSPMTGVMSMAETLWKTYDKLPEKHRKAAIETIYKSAIRLDSYDSNIRELSKLSSPEAELNIAPVHISNLIMQSLKTRIKLYLNYKYKEKYQFITNLDESILVDCDAYYLTQTLDNLIINAITYCKQGKITLSLTRSAESIEFSIKDQGIGIPQEDLYDIFGSFTISSKTKTPSGGRGVGLALCKKVSRCIRVQFGRRAMRKKRAFILLYR